MDSSLKKIVVAFGIIVVLLGALLTWRGFHTAIPVMGIIDGGVYAVAGIFFVLIGLGILFIPPWRAHKKAKKLRDEEKLRAKIQKEMKK